MAESLATGPVAGRNSVHRDDTLNQRSRAEQSSAHEDKTTDEFAMNVGAFVEVRLIPDFELIGTGVKQMMLQMKFQDKDGFRSVLFPFDSMVYAFLGQLMTEARNNRKMITAASHGCSTETNTEGERVYLIVPDVRIRQLSEIEEQELAPLDSGSVREYTPRDTRPNPPPRQQQRSGDDTSPRPQQQPRQDSNISRGGRPPKSRRAGNGNGPAERPSISMPAPTSELHHETAVDEPDENLQEVYDQHRESGVN